MNWYVFEKCEKRVLVLCDELLIEDVVPKLIPFITCKKYDNLIKDTWKIVFNDFVTVSSNAILMKNELVDQDEPTREVWIDFSIKEICIKKPEPFLWQSQILIRLIRDLLRNLVNEDLNSVFMHAAMVNYKGKGICIMGEKKAGKTTTMLNLCTKGASFISNDDLSFQLKGSIKGIGWPRAISIRNDVFKALPYFKKKNFIGKNKLTHPSNRNKLSNLYTFIYPSELQNVLGNKIESEYKVDIILFSEFSSGNKAPVIKKLTHDEALNLCVLNVVDNLNIHTKEFSSNFLDYTKDYYFHLLSEYIGDLECYKITQNFDDLNESLNLIDDVI